MSEASRPEKRRRRVPGLTAQIAIGMALGVVAGVVFGEWMSVMQIVGDLFVGLLQMTVLPYIVVALVPSLGRLTYRDVAILGRHAGLFILVFWAVTIVILLAMLVCLPAWPSATFFSTSMIELPTPLDPVALYIPSNPFFSLANSVVPAVVMFSVACGLALIGVPRKQVLIDNLEIACDVVVRIAQSVVRVAPIGVFAIVAATAGTISVDDLGRVQVYLLTNIVAAIILGLIVLPGMIAVLTPLSYRQVLSRTQDVLITGFAAYNLLIVLPILVERTKELLQTAEMRNADSEGVADLIAPLNFNLPNLGKLLTINFIPFAAWLVGTPLATGQLPQLLLSGILSLFAEAVVAIPFLLDLMHVAADTFPVFLVVDQFAGRFGVFVSGMHTVALAVLTSAAITGRLRISWRRLGQLAAITAAACVLGFGGTRLLLEHVMPRQYRAHERLLKVELRSEPVPMQRFDVSAVPALETERPGSRLDRVLRRGSLRLGFPYGSLPFAYESERAELVGLVGLDIDLMHVLAHDLGVTLEVAELPRDRLAAELDAGRIDVAIGGLFATPNRARDLRLCTPYLDASLSFVVLDHWRSAFQSWEAVLDLEDLHFAMIDIQFYRERIERALPTASITTLDSAAEYFAAEPGTFDALVFSAEAGSAWTLLRPQYSVVVPRPVRSVPVAYAVSRRATALGDYIDAWVAVTRANGTVDELYRYWILGERAKGHQRRWSVVHDVLGWDAAAEP